MAFQDVNIEIIALGLYSGYVKPQRRGRRATNAVPVQLSLTDQTTLVLAQSSDLCR